MLLTEECLQYHSETVIDTSTGRGNAGQGSKRFICGCLFSHSGLRSLRTNVAAATHLLLPCKCFTCFLI